MRVHQSMKMFLGSFALVSMLLPQARLAGAELPVSTLAQKTVEPSQEKREAASVFELIPHETELAKHRAEITDIALDRQGMLRGSFVDELGLPLPGTLVVARQGKSRVRTTQTNSQGAFALSGLKGGIWEITIGKQTAFYRIWSAEIAPPVAESNILMVKQSPVIRGQSEDTGMLAAFDAGTLFSVGAGIAGITLGTIGISEAAEANDEADDLRRELNALSATVDAIAATLN